MHVPLRPLALLIALSAGEAALAAPPSVRLVYERGPGASTCPDEQTLKDAVSARLGSDPFRDDAARTVRARVDSSGSSSSAEVRLLDDSGKVLGERTLSSRSGDCRELAAAMELAITIAIDPLVLNRPAPPAAAVVPPPPPPEPAPTPLIAAKTPEPEPDPTPRIPTRVSFLLGMLAASGAPKVAVGANAGLELRWSQFSLGFEARADLPAGMTVARGGSVSTWSASGALVPCVRWSVLGLCAVGAGGVQGAYANNLVEPRETLTPLIEVGARALAHVELTEHFALRFHIDGRVPLARTTLTVSGTPVWSSPTLAAVFGISAVGQLGR